jgi:cytochrome c5
MKKYGFITAACLLLAASLLSACAVLPGDQPTPGPTPTVDRLAEPPMPEKPSQADQGHYVYYMVCMACHGDFGQGLTDEWRAEWGEDSNCWQSKCHGNDHPAEGFAIVRTCCKAVIGPTTLQRFKNGQELFDYISNYMPWWNPGYLKTEEFWQVTNFLMRANGAIPDGVTLDAGNAFVFNLHPVAPPPKDNDWQALLVCGLLAVVAGLLFFQNKASA